MKLFSRVVAVAAAVVSLASTAQAQVNFNYFTTGEFSGGPNCTTGIGTSVTCGAVGTGLGLRFDTQPLNPNPAGYLTPTGLVFGTFTPIGTGTITVPPPAVTFTLYINQTNPTTGVTSLAGQFAGTFTRGSGGDQSSLFWTPVPTGSVPPIFYSLELNPQGSMLIGAQNPTSINGSAVGTVVPEPSTYALMAAGLAGLGMVARRRRNA